MKHITSFALAATLVLGVACSKKQIDQLTGDFGKDTTEVAEKRKADQERVNKGQASELQINLLHTMRLGTTFSNDLKAKLPQADLDNHCLQWTEYSDNQGSAEQVEMHNVACPQPAALLTDVSKIISVNIEEVDRGNTDPFADYDLKADGKIIGEVFFNDARTEANGKAILNSICQVTNGLSQDTSGACELQEADGKMSIELK